MGGVEPSNGIPLMLLFDPSLKGPHLESVAATLASKLCASHTVSILSLSTGSADLILKSATYIFPSLFELSSLILI